MCTLVRGALVAIATSAVLLSSGCLGRIGGAGGGGEENAQETAPANASPLRRLSVAQYRNSVRDLISSDVPLPTELEPDTAVNGFVSIGSSLGTISPRGVEQYEAAAIDIAHYAVSQSSVRDALLPCTPSGASDAGCIRSFVERFGSRAWRRPLTEEEIAKYADIGSRAATMLESFDAGIEFAIAGLLQSPNFLFRVEVGEDDDSSPTGMRFNDYEMASRLSYFLWNTTPDDELLAAAAAGELNSADGIRAQASRLLDSPRAREAVRNFFSEMLGLDALESLQRDSDAFPQMTSTLGASMQEGTLRTLEHFVFEANTDYRDIFTSPLVFVNRDLAPIYGVTAPESGFAMMEMPSDVPRIGLLGQASLLAATSHPTKTSPTLRGRFVRQTLLCQTIPAPPPNVGELPEPSPDARTMRERLAMHRENPACATCHKLTDPIGLAFESFDAVGAFREQDNGATIDASGDLDGVPFEDARGFAEALRNHADLEPCFVTNLYRYATGGVEDEAESGAMSTLKQSFQADHDVRGALLAIAVSDAFRSPPPRGKDDE